MIILKKEIDFSATFSTLFLMVYWLLLPCIPLTNILTKRILLSFITVKKTELLDTQ